MSPETYTPGPTPETETKAPARRVSLDPPLIPPAGRKIDLTNEQIYDLLDQR